MSDLNPMANKAVILAGPDAVVAIGYSGVAEFHGVSTDRVIAEAVAGCELGPQRLGNNAVHGPSVEAEVPAVDQSERQIAKAHRRTLRW